MAERAGNAVTVLACGSADLEPVRALDRNDPQGQGVCLDLGRVARPEAVDHERGDTHFVADEGQKANSRNGASAGPAGYRDNSLAGDRVASVEKPETRDCPMRDRNASLKRRISTAGDGQPSVAAMMDNMGLSASHSGEE
jgi:hypothetical protein